MNNIYLLKDYTVEQLIHYIDSNSITKKSLFNKLDNSKLTTEESSKFEYTINTAFKRINEPLELDMKIFYILFPFGYINSFTETHSEYIAKNKQFGFLKKIKEYYIFSLIGIILYMSLPIGIKLFKLM